MHTIIFVLLQGGPPDPGGWGDPDAIPVDQHVYLLAAAGIILGIYTILRMSAKAAKKT